MRLKERTTYLDGRGNRVMIAGLAHREQVNGQTVWWSIQGDHYTDDGRFVCLRQTEGTRREEMKFDSYTTEFNTRNIVQEDTTEYARKWWNGVNTDPRVEA